MVRRLWEACQIPDFRKLADDTHTKLCARVFGHIARDQRLPTDWLAAQIGALARADGDIDTLMQRLAGVRVWSYIAARGRLGAGQPALAGPGARGRGTAVGRAARAADQPLRRPPRHAPDAPAGGGRDPGAALGGHPPRRGHRRGPPRRPHRRSRLLSRPDRRGRREAPRAARRAACAARGDAAPRRRGGDRAGRRLRVRRRQHADLGRRADRPVEARHQRAATARADAGQRVPRRRAARAAAHQAATLRGRSGEPRSGAAARRWPAGAGRSRNSAACCTG